MKAVADMPIDEILWRLGQALRSGALSAWERGFAKSCLGAAKRGRGEWCPTARQEAVMRRIVAEQHIEDVPLIEEIGGAGG